MISTYYLTHKATEDISSIWFYTKNTWSETQADKYYQRLIYDCSKIAQNQNLGKKYVDFPNEIFGFVSNKHIIFYRKLTDSEIEIIRFLHVSMDINTKIYQF
ncbi:type II toxin-antitoxin system RelE/ParE family toxin [Aquirufa sp. ROCK-SH2]